jgi:hypothetical protein
VCGCDRSKGHPAALQRHQFALSIPRSIAVVTKRQITLMLRDSALTRGRFMQVCPFRSATAQCVQTLAWRASRDFSVLLLIPLHPWSVAH